MSGIIELSLDCPTNHLRLSTMHMLFSLVRNLHSVELIIILRLNRFYAVSSNGVIPEQRTRCQITSRVDHKSEGLDYDMKHVLIIIRIPCEILILTE